MATCKEENGILFVFESDGHEWADHLSSLLENEPYKIKCHTEHWWNLNAEMSQSYPVHVLLLTPHMESNINHEKFSFLRHGSPCSLLIEANCKSNLLDMPEWRYTESLDVTVEKQRDILSTLVKMYEEATNDVDVSHPDEHSTIDIVPTTFYPGEKTLYILTSSEYQEDVTISIEGHPKRLATFKHTKNSYKCDLPDIDSGQKMTSVYAGSHSIFTSKIVIVSCDILLENFIENLRNTLRIKSEPGKKTWHKMGVFFNPFSDYLFSETDKLYFAKIIRNLPTERDSGFSASLDENLYEQIPELDDNWSMGQKSRLRSTESTSSTRSLENKKEERNSGIISNAIKKFFRKGHTPSPQKKKFNKSSRRLRHASLHTFDKIPDLPSSRTRSWDIEPGIYRG